jgi:basic amino acid/polyamine antiporter, APA family
LTRLLLQVPFNLVVPSLSMLANIYLMLVLDVHTWIRFIVWMLLGMIIYLLYGLRHSEVKKRRTTQKSGVEVSSIYTMAMQ